MTLARRMSGALTMVALCASIALPAPAVRAQPVAASASPRVPASQAGGRTRTGAALLAQATPDSSVTTLAADADLAPTTAVPWNPPAAVPRSQTWERVVRMPGRIVTLPFTAIGMGMNALLLHLEDREILHYGPPPPPRPPTGFSIGPASLGSRTGLGLHIGLPPRPLDRFMRVDLSGSTRRYGRANGLLFQGPLGIAAEQNWRPQERFYGIGLQSRRDDRSDFASQSASVRAVLQWPFFESRASRDTALARQSHFKDHGFTTRAFAGPRTLVLRRGHETHTPSFDVRFPALAAERDLRTEQLVWGADARWDGRGGRPHHSHGSLLDLDVSRLDRPPGNWSLSTAGAPEQPWTRITFAGETNASVWRDPRTLRLSGRISHLETGTAGGVLLLPDLASLGGSAGLGGYETNRFIDRDVLVAKLAYIFPLEQFVEMEVHAERGGVYPDVRHDLTLRSLKPSYGIQIRPRGPAGVAASGGVDWSPERLRFTFSLGGVE